MSSHQIYDIHLKLNLILRVCYDLFTPAVDSGTFFNYVPPRGLKQTFFFKSSLQFCAISAFALMTVLLTMSELEGSKQRKFRVYGTVTVLNRLGKFDPTVKLCKY
jgi:hypothetical protein